MPVTTEICGHGRVAVDVEDRAALVKYNDSLVGAKETEWIAHMQNSSDLRTRAAGLLLDGREYGDNLISSASERARNDLVQLAVGTRDPAVYGLGVQMCRRYQRVEGSDACQQISVTRWAQLEPGNAAPWFVMAEQAHAAQDEATEAMAFERASHATQWHQYTDELIGFADPTLPKDLPAYDKMVLQLDVGHYGIVLSDYPWGIVVDRCSQTALQDSARLPACSSIANLLVDQGRSFMGFGIGLRIGERVGWPAARLDALRDEFAALHSPTLATQMESLGCDAIKRRDALIRVAIDEGELAAARAFIQTVGISVADLAKNPETPVEVMLDQLETAVKPRHVEASP